MWKHLVQVLSIFIISHVCLHTTCMEGIDEKGVKDCNLCVHSYMYMCIRTDVAN